MADDTQERYINPYTDFGFKKLFGTEMNKDLLISSHSESERRQYEESKKVFWDNYSVIKTATDKGHAKGLAEGKAEVARNLKAMGLSAPDIAKATGLTAEEINKL